MQSLAMGLEGCKKGNILIDGEKIFDLGAGINGFSYNYFPKGVYYVGIEAMGQLVDLMNYYAMKCTVSLLILACNVKL